jgi:hypothetical protein
MRCTTALAQHAVHHLPSPEINKDLGFVVEHLPGRSRMLLTSRVDPR